MPALSAEYLGPTTGLARRKTNIEGARSYTRRIKERVQYKGEAKRLSVAFGAAGSQKESKSWEQYAAARRARSRRSGEERDMGRQEQEDSEAVEVMTR